MKKLLSLILLLAACSANPNKSNKAQAAKDTLITQATEGAVLSAPTNTLNGKTETKTKNDTTLYLSYNAISCTCAQWSETKAVSDSTKEYYYLEPANDKLINADTLWDGEHLPLQIQVTGQIVSYSGYPTGFNPGKGSPEPANVFRYTKIKVLKNKQRATHFFRR